MMWARMLAIFSVLVVTGASIGTMLNVSTSGLSSDIGEESSSYNPTIASIIENVSLQHIYHYTYDLQNFTTRFLPTTELNLSAEYIYNEYASNPDVMVKSQYFEYNGYWVRNIIATIPAFNPSNKTVYLLGGHYDSYSNTNPTITAPGADDDASGTAATMEAARVLSRYKFNATIILASWTAEEFGLHGSRYFAKEAKRTGMEIGGMIQLDMIGFDPGNFMGLHAVGNLESVDLLNEFWNSNQDYSIGLNLVTSIDPTARASDHAPFWDEGYPAILGIETDFNDYYHSPQDTVDKMNFELVTRTARTAIATIAKLAGVYTPGNGILVLDKTSYSPTDSVEISLYDTDLNKDPGVAETVEVSIRSSSEALGERVTLTEVAPNEGAFKGSIQLTLASPSPGELTVSNSDILNATYLEENPSGLRWANAKVDGVLPTISNVVAIPSVTTASISWDTNEDADSLVSFGLTTSLGSYEYDWHMTSSHSVMLSGLIPGTQYFFQVSSVDLAGNKAIDDNNGLKHSFITLTGQSVTPEYGYVGWVREEEPTGNHFTDPEIIVGYSNRRHTTYLGGAQFQVSPIPDGATITNATLQLYGGRWIYDEDDYQWKVALLNSSIDANWINHSYGDIDGAGSDLVMTPVLTDADLIEGRWNFFYFQPSEFWLLRDHFNNSRISFRISGPTSNDFFARGLIFTWVSGNEGGASMVSPYAPRLTLTYSTSGDILGPLVTYAEAKRANGAGEPMLVLNATASDIGRGDSNITAIEYFVGADPGLGNGVAMHPTDGRFDSPQKICDIVIDVSSWAPGNYSFNFRARDGAGNWGPSYSLIVDLTPPLPPSNVDARLEGDSLENMNITWDLSLDDGQGENDVTHYSIYYGTSYDRTAESYVYLSSVPAGTSFYVHQSAGSLDPRSLYYAVLANDTSGNAKRAANQAAKFSRSLTPGLHLISNPLSVGDDSIEFILQTVDFDRVWRYEPPSVNPWTKMDSSKPYLENHSLPSGSALWVEVTSSSEFMVAGRVPLTTTLSLHVGWNLVAYPSLIPRDASEILLGIPHTNIESYALLSEPYHLEKLSEWGYLYPGHGYWIYSQVDTTLELSN